MNVFKEISEWNDRRIAKARHPMDGPNDVPASLEDLQRRRVEAGGDINSTYKKRRPRKRVLARFGGPIPVVAVTLAVGIGAEQLIVRSLPIRKRDTASVSLLDPVENYGAPSNACIPVGFWGAAAAPKDATPFDPSDPMYPYSFNNTRLGLPDARPNSSPNFQAAMAALYSEDSADSHNRRVLFSGERQAGSINEYIDKCYDNITLGFMQDPGSGAQDMVDLMVKHRKDLKQWVNNFINTHPRFKPENPNSVKVMMNMAFDAMSENTQNPAEKGAISVAKQKYNANEQEKNANIK